MKGELLAEFREWATRQPYSGDAERLLVIRRDANNHPRAPAPFSLAAS
jgi:hypothetical protein